jgi:hypothetical protein
MWMRDCARTFPINFDLLFKFFSQQLLRMDRVVGSQIFPACPSSRFENGVNRAVFPHPKQPMPHPLKPFGFLPFFAPG